MQHESLAGDPPSPVQSQTPDEECQHWFSLCGANGSRFALPDSTVLRLMRVLTVPPQSAGLGRVETQNQVSARRSAASSRSGQPVDLAARTRQLMRLAFEDPGWASWLASFVLDNSSGWLGGQPRVLPSDGPGLFQGADSFQGADFFQGDQTDRAANGSEAVLHQSSLSQLFTWRLADGSRTDWKLIEAPIRQLIQDPRFTAWLVSRMGSVVWSREEAEAWWQLRHRTMALCQRVTKVDWTTPAMRDAVYWWTLILGSRLEIGTLATPADSRSTSDWDAFLAVYREQRAAAQSCDDVTVPPMSAPSADVAALARQTLERVQQAERLERRFDDALESAKLSAMKELAYGASHEINNPLANISSRAQMLLRGETDPKRRKSLATINRQAFRAHEMLADMMLFAKPPALDSTTFEWNGFCACVLESLRGLLDDEDLSSEIELRTETSTRPAFVFGDKSHLHSAVQAVWRNAIEAIGESGLLAWRASVVDAAPGEDCRLWAELEIRDSGPGIPAEVRRHIFDPFYSGREAGRGLGFGLSKAWRVIELHRGQIIVDGGTDRLTSILLRLPASDQMPTSPD